MAAGYDTPEQCRRHALMARYEANRTEGALKAAWLENEAALLARAANLELERGEMK